MPTFSDQDCIMAIAEGEVVGVGPIDDAARMLVENPHVTEIVRMPLKAAGRFFLEPWPGREAALALLSQEPGDA
ncbi:hypothetical protein ACLBYG_21825 [Methylobacterium sp. D53M]